MAVFGFISVAVGFCDTHEKVSGNPFGSEDPRASSETCMHFDRPARARVGDGGVEAGLTLTVTVAVTGAPLLPFTVSV